jgi:hypothetical protein
MSSRVTEWYGSLNAAVREVGCFTNGLENRGRWIRTTVCSSCGPGRVLGGISFWATRLADEWYLGTWGCRIYRVRDLPSVVGICTDWMPRASSRSMHDFDEESKNAFGLVSVTEDEFEKAVLKSNKGR